MAKDPLIVPTLLPSGSLHFAEIPADGTAQHVIDNLVRSQEVTSDILGELAHCTWALQRIMKEPPGRQWEEQELEHLDDGILPPNALVAPIVHRVDAGIPPQRHFSSFTLTSHLHTPFLRLVSLHPLLSITISFLRVPEVHDGYKRKYYIGRNTTVEDLIKTVTEELGLSSSLPIPGDGNIDYVIEEVWLHGKVEKGTRLPTGCMICNVSASPFASNPFSSSAKRIFRFCVPDEWYRRSRSPSISRTPLAKPSEAALKRLVSTQEQEERGSEEDEGTAKMREAPSSPNRSTELSDSPDWKDTFSQNRLSSLFEGWFVPTSPTTSTRVGATSTSQKKTVSEPKLVSHHTGNGLRSPTAISEENEEEDEEVDLVAFEKMLDDLNLKGQRRAEMHELVPERKRYLLRQNQEFRRTVQGSRPAPSTNNFQAASVGPAGSATFLPRLVPQRTGDLMKRFSIIGWGSSSSSSPVAPEHLNRMGNNSEMPSKSGESNVEDMTRLQPQVTGWSSWWASSGGEKAITESTKSAKSYVDRIRAYRSTDIKLVKNLISLRVHLSTAKLLWIEEFVNEKGLEALSTILSGLVGKGGKKRMLGDVESTVLIELMKCLRILLNTELGFNQVLASPNIITHVAYSLHAASPKLQTLASELLAAVCLVSLTEGHKAVLAALSDFRVVYEESFRLESLINSLRLPDIPDESDDGEPLGYGNEEEGIWEARTASMALVNALTNCPDALEERIMLREELSRRGLNEVIVALRYVKPPDSLLTQLDVYTEEKFEDEEDMRERVHASMTKGRTLHQRQRSESEIALQDLVVLAKQHGELYPMMVEILSHYGQLLNRDVGIQLKADLFAILDKFVEQAALLDNFDDSWHVFMKRFASSVQHITGQELEVKAISDTGSMTVIEQELEELRSKVEELSEERTELRDNLNQQIAELNALKSLPLNLSVPNAKSTGKGSEGFHGLVQRLVQKEKQVLQLQTELDRFKIQNPNEGRDADERAKRDRDRAKWNHLMDEISKHKVKIEELESSAGIKDKEIIYLKRALESVYTRFLSREELREEERAAELDAELIATRAIETLTQKDAQIAALSIEIADLKSQLAMRQKFASEKEFKAKAMPPPPPLVKNKPVRSPAAVSIPTDSLPARSSTNRSLSSLDTSTMTLPPPPPPPPLSNRSASTRVFPSPVSRCEDSPMNLSHTTSISCPSPPPPPPPPLPPLSPATSSQSPPALLQGTLSPLSGNGSPPPPPPPPVAFRAKRMGGGPSKRLKPFFWNKLEATAVQATFWNESHSVITLDMDDLETTFSMEKPPSSPSHLGRPSRKRTVTSLLDITRANNIAIMLSRIKLGFSEIRSALLRLEDQVLSIDDLKAIGRQLPTTEEIGRLRSVEDVKDLARPDQYFSHIVTIPRLSERLDCMVYRRSLELDIEEIRPELDILRNACHELRFSSRFKQVMQVVLAVGNALNSSSFRGGARGFRLEALLKMKETKTGKGSTDCPTLLHYLARVLLRTDATLLQFMDELLHLEPAARVSTQTIIQTVNTLVSGLARIKEEIRQLQQLGCSPEDDRFIDVMQPFVKQNTPSVEALRKMGSVLEGEMRSLLIYYGEDPDSPDAPKPEDFFGLVLSFSSSLQKCAVEVHDAEQKRQPQIMTPTVQVSNTEPTPHKHTPKANQEPPLPSSLLPPPHGESTPSASRANSQGYAAGVRSIGRGDLDQAIRSMRDGKRRPRQPRPLSKIFLDGGRQ